VVKCLLGPQINPQYHQSKNEKEKISPVVQRKILTNYYSSVRSGKKTCHRLNGTSMVSLSTCAFGTLITKLKSDT
jgi:hypothetical protein